MTKPDNRTEAQRVRAVCELLISDDLDGTPLRRWLLALLESALVRWSPHTAELVPLADRVARDREGWHLVQYRLAKRSTWSVVHVHDREVVAGGEVLGEYMVDALEAWPVAIPEPELER